MERQNLYKFLGISNNAGLNEIKKAFHKQALKWHPDKNQSNNAKQMFNNIKYAYQVLRDDTKRKQYDEQNIFDETNENIAGYLDSFGQRLSDIYKKKNRRVENIFIQHHLYQNKHKQQLNNFNILIQIFEI